jgi:lipopolysaccharide export system protein LptA
MVLMKRWTAAAAATALILAAGGSAYAPSDSSAPVDVSADNQETINSKCIIDLHGQRGDPAKPLAPARPEGDVYSPQAGVGRGQWVRQRPSGWRPTAASISSAISRPRAATTPSTPTDNNIAVLTGDVVLVKGKDVARGDKLTVNTKTNDAKLESNSPKASKRRVRAVFYQDEAKKLPTRRPRPTRPPSARTLTS